MILMIGSTNTWEEMVSADKELSRFEIRDCPRRATREHACTRTFFKFESICSAIPCLASRVKEMHEVRADKLARAAACDVASLAASAALTTISPNMRPSTLRVSKIWW